MTERDDDRRERSECANDAKGHKALLAWLKKKSTRVRVCLEATCNYSMHLALALHRAKDVQVMVANPGTIADFGRALMQRSKTDALDAEMILEFVKGMPFVEWEPPSPQRLNLRAIMRRVSAHKHMAQQEKNRAHAAEQTNEITRLIERDIDQHVRQLEHHVAKLEDEAYEIVQSNTALAADYERLISVRGVARVSALHILAELAILAPDMSAGSGSRTPASIRDITTPALLYTSRLESVAPALVTVRITAAPAGHQHNHQQIGSISWSYLSGNRVETETLAESIAVKNVMEFRRRVHA